MSIFKSIFNAVSFLPKMVVSAVSIIIPVSSAVLEAEKLAEAERVAFVLKCKNGRKWRELVISRGEELKGMLDEFNNTSNLPAVLKNNLVMCVNAFNDFSNVVCPYNQKIDISKWTLDIDPNQKIDLSKWALNI